MSFAPAEATVVSVLGMSRSGTSLTARILDLAGVYFGPEDELLGGELGHLAGEGEKVVARAREANPDGFWEHYRLMRLNERILRRFGGNWREPPFLPPGWEASGELEEERKEARALLEEGFSGHRLWGWKDPRTSLTLPFWRRLVPDVRCVICLRDPVEVAASIKVRDGLVPEVGLELWVIYMASALAYSSGRPRLFVPYGSYFQEATEAVAKLARFAGCEEALEREEFRQGVAEAVDPSLWRNRAEAIGDGGGASLADRISSLYLIVRLLAAHPVEGDAELDAAVDGYARQLLETQFSLAP